MPVYKPSLFRQVLPWLFVAVFIVAAPVVIFYTSGYRYNVKKGQIERSGTFIVDSTPKGAQVFLDGTDTKEVTPITFQNITPGWHDLRVAKDGYTDWTKRLELRPGQVTFANTIWLWRKTQPALQTEGPFTACRADQSRDKLALLLSSATSVSIVPWVAEGQASPPLILPDVPPKTAVDLFWKNDGLALLAAAKTENGRSVLVSWNKANAPAQVLPVASYHWSGGQLLGLDRNTAYVLNSATGELERAALPAQTVDQDNNYSLQTATSTNQLLLKEQSLIKRVFSLPFGNWRFGTIEGQYVLLRDFDRWLAVRPQAGADAQAQEAAGDYPRWLKAGSTQALFINQNELWSWSLDSPPVLLWRESKPIAQAIWHRSGTAVILALDNHVYALALDDRGGRNITDLAQFDAIYDLDALGTTLYVAGTKDGKQGLWSLEIE